MIGMLAISGLWKKNNPQYLISHKDTKTLRNYETKVFGNSLSGIAVTQNYPEKAQSTQSDIES